MRIPYEPPEISVLGSVTDLTQANLFGPSADFLLILRGPEDDDLYS